jgi:hypothetical protein
MRTSLEACLLPLAVPLSGGSPEDGRAVSAARVKVRVDGILRQDVAAGPRFEPTPDAPAPPPESDEDEAL